MIVAMIKKKKKKRKRERERERERKRERKKTTKEKIYFWNNRHATISALKNPIFIANIKRDHTISSSR